MTSSRLTSVPCNVSMTSGKVQVLSAVKPSIRAVLMSNSIYVSDFTPTLGGQPKTRAKLTALMSESSPVLPRLSWEMDSSIRIPKIIKVKKVMSEPFWLLIINS